MTISICLYVRPSVYLFIGTECSTPCCRMGLLESRPFRYLRIMTLRCLCFDRETLLLRRLLLLWFHNIGRAFSWNSWSPGRSWSWTGSHHHLSATLQLIPGQSKRQRYNINAPVTELINAPGVSLHSHRRAVPDFALLMCIWNGLIGDSGG